MAWKIQYAFSHIRGNNKILHSSKLKKNVLHLKFFHFWNKRL